MSKRKILVLIDVQNDYMKDAPNNYINKLSDEVNSLSEGDELYIVSETHFEDEGISRCIWISEGWKTPRLIQDNTPDYISPINLEKSTSAFLYWDTCLSDFLVNDADKFEVNICGMNLSTSILTNAIMIKEYYPEVDVNVIMNLCPADKDTKNIISKVLTGCGIRVCTTSD